MKVLLVGSSGREHAIAEALKRSGVELYSVLSNRNPGIIRLSESYKVCDICDTDVVSAFAEKKDVSLAIIGPEAPLSAGVVDVLEAKGIRCASPKKSLALIETDKAFCRDLMAKYGINGNIEFHTFIDKQEACDFIDSTDKEYVIKPAGLTGGKGVKIMGEHLKDKDETKECIKEIFDMRIGSVPKIVIEERLVGEEVTLQVFTDGKTVIPMPLVQDHKRAFEGDIGPNTGGMGSYSDKGHMLPFIDKQDYDTALGIIKDTILALDKEKGFPYKGVLYGQFMLTKEGPKVIEFNARFGDPEAMNVLSLLKSDLADVLKAIAKGTLEEVNFLDKASVCKYLVPEGYPSSPKKGAGVNFDEKAVNDLGASVFYAAVDKNGKRVVTTGSRSLAVVGLGENLAEAERIAEQAASMINNNLVHRKDIGTKELIDKKITHMREVKK